MLRVMKRLNYLARFSGATCQNQVGESIETRSNRSDKHLEIIMFLTKTSRSRPAETNSTGT